MLCAVSAHVSRTLQPCLWSSRVYPRAAGKQPFLWPSREHKVVTPLCLLAVVPKIPPEPLLQSELGAVASRQPPARKSRRLACRTETTSSGKSTSRKTTWSWMKKHQCPAFFKFLQLIVYVGHAWLLEMAQDVGKRKHTTQNSAPFADLCEETMCRSKARIIFKE